MPRNCWACAAPHWWKSCASTACSATKFPWRRKTDERREAISAHVLQLIHQDTPTLTAAAHVRLRFFHPVSDPQLPEPTGDARAGIDAERASAEPGRHRLRPVRRGQGTQLR